MCFFFVVKISMSHKAENEATKYMTVPHIKIHKTNKLLTTLQVWKWINRKHLAAIWWNRKCNWQNKKQKQKKNKSNKKTVERPIQYWMFLNKSLNKNLKKVKNSYFWSLRHTIKSAKWADKRTENNAKQEKNTKK